MIKSALLPKPDVQMAKPLPASTPSQVFFAQRKATLPGQGETMVAAPRDAGQKLAPAVREEMERGFDSDFSSVQIHDDAAAHDSARAINARAYTAGNNIVFGEGAYRPDSKGGKALLAHELAHTLQQDGVQMKSNDPLPTAFDSELEREADRAALTVTSGRSAGAMTRVNRPTVFKAEGDPPAGTSADTVDSASPADDGAPTAPPPDIPADVEVIEETPSGPGATRLVVQMGTLKLPRVKGKGEWVEQAYKARASGGGLIFTPKFKGGSFGAATSVAAYAEKPGEKYKNVWLNNYGFKTLRGMATTFKEAATRENADPEVKAAYEDEGAKNIINQYSLSNKLPAGGCDIDHIVEKQLKGTSTPGNLQLLVSSKNQESGRETYKYLKSETERVLSPNRKNVVDFQMRFNDVQLVADDSDGSYIVEKTLRSGKVKGSDEVAASAGGTAILLEAGGNREVVYGRKGETTGIDMGDRRLIPGMKLKTYQRARNSSASGGIDTVKAILASKPLIPGSKDITLLATVTKAPVESDGSAGKSGEKKAAASEFRKLQLHPSANQNLPFHYPYLSPGYFRKLAVDENQNLTGEGVIKPSIKFLGDLKVRFGPDQLDLVQDIDVATLNKSAYMRRLAGYFRFTDGSLAIDLVNFKPSGNLGFSVGPYKKPIMTGNVNAMVDNGNFVAKGTLAPGAGLPGSGDISGAVGFSQTSGWSGEIKLPPKIEILPNATVTGKVGFIEEDGQFQPYADGAMNAVILGQNVEFSVGWSNRAKTMVYRGALAIKKPFPMVDQLKLSAAYTGGNALYLNGTASLNWRNIVTGSGKISYTITKDKQKGWFYGEVDINFKKDKLNGSGKAIFGDDGIKTIDASCTYQLTEKIKATVGVKYSRAAGKKTEDRFLFTGAVNVSNVKLFDPWPKTPAKKTFLDIGHTQYIPIPPFPAISISLSMTGELGARYQFGPGTIGGTVTIEGYFLSEDPRIKAKLDSALKLPAFGELYGRFGVMIGAAVAQGLVGAEGGVYLKPSIRIDLLGSVIAEADYVQDRGFSFSGLAKVDGSLTGSFAVDAAVSVYFMRGLLEKEWLIPIEKWGPVDLIDKFTLILGKVSYSSEKGMTWPSLSDISISPEKYSPMTMIKGMLEKQKGEKKSARKIPEHIQYNSQYAKMPLY